MDEIKFCKICGEEVRSGGFYDFKNVSCCSSRCHVKAEQKYMAERFKS